MLKIILALTVFTLLARQSFARDVVQVSPDVTCAVYGGFSVFNHNSGNFSTNTELESNGNAHSICGDAGYEISKKINQITNVKNYFLAVKVISRDMYAVGTEIFVVRGGNVDGAEVLGKVNGGIWWYPGDSGYTVHSLTKMPAGTKWREQDLIPPTPVYDDTYPDDED